MDSCWQYKHKEGRYLHYYWSVQKLKQIPEVASYTLNILYHINTYLIAVLVHFLQ